MLVSQGEREREAKKVGDCEEVSYILYVLQRTKTELSRCL